MKLRKTALLLIAVSLFFTISTQAKTKKLLRFNLQKGSVYEMTTDMNNIMDQEVMGQQVKMDQKMKMIATMTVEDVLPNNNILVSYIYKSMKMDMSTMGNTMSFDTDKQDDNNPASEAFKRLTKIKLKMEITPLGKVVNIEGFDRFDNAFTAMPQAKEMLKMFSSEESFKSSIGQTFNYFPEEKIAVGDSWDTTQKMDAIMNMEINMHFEVTDIQKDDVVLKIDSDINSDTTIEQNGMDIDMKMNGNQTGNMTINSKDGMLNTSNMTQAMSILMKMKNPQNNEDMEIPMKINSTIAVSVSKM